MAELRHSSHDLFELESHSPAPTRHHLFQARRDRSLFNITLSQERRFTCPWRTPQSTAKRPIYLTHGKTVVTPSRTFAPLFPRRRNKFSAHKKLRGFLYPPDDTLLCSHLTHIFKTASKMLPTSTMSAPALHFTLPPSSFLEYPPPPEPAVLSPPEVDFSWARPFKIDPEIYNNFMNVEYPITIALIYFAVVTVLNRRNVQRDHKPWAFTKTTAFYAFVLAHNVFLAIYSGWTFIGMLNAFRHTWPGLLGENGIVGAVDSMCKINGPRGLGSAATYDPIGNSWGFTDRAMKLVDGNPDNTDVGRMWNEGLAYYGWLFYISKFYEMVDTLIVLAKGKNSSVLQTYHHAGAMMCMWAGIRYMSPPIWMFVLINSGLHAMMVSGRTLK